MHTCTIFMIHTCSQRLCSLQIATLFEIDAEHDFSSDQRKQIQEIFASAMTESGTAAGALRMLRLWPSLQRDGCSSNRVLANLFDNGLSSLAVDWALEDLSQERQVVAFLEWRQQL